MQVNTDDSQLVFKLLCKHGIVKTHRLNFEDSDSIQVGRLPCRVRFGTSIARALKYELKKPDRPGRSFFCVQAVYDMEDFNSSFSVPARLLSDSMQ